MNARSFPGIVFTIALSALLAGCSDQSPPPANDDDATGAESFIGRQVTRGIAEAKRELETANIRVGNNSRITVNGRSYGAGRGADNLPKAEISPDGEFLISGEPVPTTAGQRELLLAHRGQLIGIAHAGMDIGAQGAGIAGTALSGIGNLVFGGEEGRKDFEERIEAEADKIQLEAVKLCSLLPGLYDSQQTLAASLPEFVPYATMTRKDVDECGSDIDADTGVFAATGLPT